MCQLYCFVGRNWRHRIWITWTLGAEWTFRMDIQNGPKLFGLKELINRPSINHVHSYRFYPTRAGQFKQFVLWNHHRLEFMNGTSSIKVCDVIEWLFTQNRLMALFLASCKDGIWPTTEVCDDDSSRMRELRIKRDHLINLIFRIGNNCPCSA